VLVQTENNYGTAGISADGQEMIVFIGDRSSGSLFRIEKEGSSWSRPMPLGDGIHSRYMESTASMTPDSKTIYFASNRPGGYGGMDIYKSERKADGTWGKAVNLGPSINSRANEDAPFIHPNNSLLFFTTDRPGAIGGNDIYKSERVNDEWQEPKNMGYPINTTNKNIQYVPTGDGFSGIYSRRSDEGIGQEDIWSVKIIPHEEATEETLTRLSEKDFKIEIIDKKTGEQIELQYDAAKDAFSIVSSPDKEYKIVYKGDDD
jgi:hypothetical protein